VYFAKYYGCSYVCTHKTKVEASRDVGDLRGALLVAGRPTRQKRGAGLGKKARSPLHKQPRSTTANRDLA
jgi:hypothetical protein